MEKPNLSKFYGELSKLSDEKALEKRSEALGVAIKSLKKVGGDVHSIRSVVAATAKIIKIAGLVKGLFDLFSKGKPDKKWINALFSEIAHVKQLLVDVIQILKNLEVKIEQEFEKFVNIQLMASLETAFDNSDDWITKPGDHKDEISDSLISIQEKARAAMKYGFAHLDAVMLALRMELFLINLRVANGAEPPKRINKVLKRYKDFLNTFKDDNLSGSPANAIRIYQEKNKQLNSRFPATRIPVYYDHRLWYSGRCENEQEKSHWLHIGGNISSGFTFRRDGCRLGWRRDCEPPDHDHRQSEIELDNLHSISRKRFPHYRNISCPSTDEHQQRYEAAEQEFKRNLLRIGALEKVLENVENYMALIDKMSQQKISN